MMEITLRAWQVQDAAGIAIYANNKNIANNLRDVFPYPYTRADAREYVRGCMEADAARQLTRAIAVDGYAVGSIGVFLRDDVYRRSAELGYWLAEPFWGKGIMSAAIRQICAEAFERYDIVRIFAEPYAYNTGSRRALEKAGFALEGVLKSSVWKNEAFHDSCVYALLK